jgi:serine/threonine-protein kinase
VAYVSAVTLRAATTCPTCGSAVRDGDRFCPACGTSLDVADSPTGTAPRRAAPGSFSPSPAAVRATRSPGVAPAERFAPGAVLLDRYRVVGLVGRGGMGEVYRAFDLKLEQPVALKFLPRALEGDPGRLERLYGEVRMARQVSHPAVCRVWDVGEAEGSHFLSMELVDGENLASLLRRIGRLPVDKALDIARQVASGLAAAHEKGVLHRDLKPANVMLDSEGKVRLTDFGLAGLAEGLAGEDVRSGTPSYMSPEQLQGREVSARSDIYSLGLLIYELVTGRRAFEGRGFAELARKHRDERPIDPSAIVPELPSAVERTILACLEKDPKKRPPSAGAVVAMLSGQDPLAAAIAAGETPSPELVAAAGDQTAMRPRAVAACLAVVVTGALLVPFAQQWNAILARVPVEKSPAALEDRARELLSRLGHAGPAADSEQGLFTDEDQLRALARQDGTLARWDGLRTGEPPVVQYWYRQSPRPLVASNLGGRVSSGDPPVAVSGMAGVRYDLRGRLVSLYVVPPQKESAPAPETPADPDWAALFAEAKLDPARLERTEPLWSPPFYCDRRAAWEGTWPGRPDVGLRVEAAGHRGRPVWFHLVSPWTRAERDQPFVPTRGQRVALGLLLAILATLVVGAAVLAKRNLRLGRGDRRGAFRLASGIFALGMAGWLLSAHHVADPLGQVLLTIRGAGLALVLAGTLWLFHLALEPYVRRERPWTLVSWTRLLDGGLRDPVVWRDGLVGATWGVLAALAAELALLLPEALGRPHAGPSVGVLDTLVSPRARLAFAVGRPLNAALLGLGILLLFLFLRLLLRRDRPAALALVAVLSAVSVVQSEQPLWLSLPLSLLFVGALVFLLMRFGLLAAVAGLSVSDYLILTPQSLELDSWLGGATVVAVPAVIAIAAYAARQSTRRSPLPRTGAASDASASYPA